MYGHTTWQYTPTSPLGFKGRSTPLGAAELSLNPLQLMLASGATFIARGYSNSLDLLKKTFKEAIMHKGFSLIDVLQPCVTFFNTYEYYNKHVYELTDHDSQNYEKALKKIREWDYNSDNPIALGTFYKKESPSFEERFLEHKTKTIDKYSKIKETLAKYI